MKEIVKRGRVVSPEGISYPYTVSTRNIQSGQGMRISLCKVCKILFNVCANGTHPARSNERIFSFLLFIY